jgi:DNA polymerase-3 subunit epsilon
MAAGGQVGSRPWRQASWCAVDLELTGLDARVDHIVAIGAVPIERGRVLRDQALYTLVRTRRPSQPGALRLHRLDAAELERAPSLAEALGLLAGVLQGRVPVFHTAAVERAFLEPALRARGLRLGPCADTEVLGRLWLASRDGAAPRALPLARLAAQLGQNHARPHHALGDALATAHAFVALASTLERAWPQTVASLVHARLRLTPARRLGPS